MGRNDKLQSRKSYKMTDSPEPFKQLDWENMEESERPKGLFLNGMPSRSAIITLLFFFALILFLIYM